MTLSGEHMTRTRHRAGRVGAVLQRAVLQRAVLACWRAGEHRQRMGHRISKTHIARSGS